MAQSVSKEASLEEAVSELDKEISCSICHDHCAEPKVLPCLHYYCKQCIYNLAVRRGISRPFSCPECRQSTTLPPGGVDSLPPAFFVNRMKEIHAKFESPLSEEENIPNKCGICHRDKQPKAHCELCDKYICGKCLKWHKRENKSHQVRHLGEVRGTNQRVNFRQKHAPMMMRPQREEPEVVCYAVPYPVPVFIRPPVQPEEDVPQVTTWRQRLFEWLSIMFVWLSKHLKAASIAAVVVVLLALVAAWFMLNSATVPTVTIKALETQASSWRASDCVHILVIGRHESGKHALVQGLLDVEDFDDDEISILDTCFEVTFWTLPEDWEMVSEELPRKLDLVIYAQRLDSALSPVDIYSLQRLTREFGDILWRKGLFAFTYAVKVDNSVDQLRLLKSKIQNALLDEKVSKAVLSDVPFVSALHADREPWTSRLLKCAIVKMSSENWASGAGGVLWMATKDRVEHTKETLQCH